MAEVYFVLYLFQIISFFSFSKIQGNIKVLTNERDNLSILYDQVRFLILLIS